MSHDPRLPDSCKESDIPEGFILPEVELSDIFDWLSSRNDADLHEYMCDFFVMLPGHYLLDALAMLCSEDAGYSAERSRLIKLVFDSWESDARERLIELGQ